MTADAPLTDDEDTVIFRAIEAAVNYHGFDARLEMADFDVAEAIVETRTAAGAPGGLVAAVESILSARETALRETIAQEIEAHPIADGYPTSTRAIARIVRGQA